MRIDRRAALKVFGAGSAALAGLGGNATVGAAETRANGVSQGAGFYRFKIGDIDAALVSDGTFAFNPPYPVFGANASEKEVKQAIKRAFIADDSATAHRGSSCGDQSAASRVARCV